MDSTRLHQTVVYLLLDDRCRRWLPHHQCTLDPAGRALFVLVDKCLVFACHLFQTKVGWLRVHDESPRVLPKYFTKLEASFLRQSWKSPLRCLRPVPSTRRDGHGSDRYVRLFPRHVVSGSPSEGLPKESPFPLAVPSLPRSTRPAVHSVPSVHPSPFSTLVVFNSDPHPTPSRLGVARGSVGPTTRLSVTEGREYSLDVSDGVSSSRRS